MSEWRECTLGEVLELKRGYDLPTRLRTAGPFPVVSSSGITGTHKEAKVKGPGVATGRYGTLGEVFYIDGDFWPLNTTLYVRDFKGNDPKFIGYFLRTIDFFAYSDKAAVPGVNRNHLHQAPVVVPDLQTQRKIAHILGTLDDKIELNRRMNRTLEAIARAIFKSWFVDFDPVRAKAEGSEPVGMDPETAALFPDSFQDSPLGKIPKGWEVGAIANLGEIVCGKTPPTADPENYGNAIPFVTIPDMHGKVFTTKTSRSLSEAGAATQPKKLLPRLAVCVSCIATPGLVALTSEPSHTNQQINSIICKSGISPYWCYLQLAEMSDRIVMGGAGGSATLNLNKGQFSALAVEIPPSSLQKTFHAVVAPIFEAILANSRERGTLAALRDLLLPNLLAGEL